MRKPTPKTQAGHRTLVLPRFAIDTLLRRKVAQGFNPIDGVFVTRKGTWLSTNNVHRQWRLFRADMGVNDTVTFKAFRKAMATLLEREFSVEQAQAQLGHSKSTTTRSYYIARPAVAPDSSDLLDDLFG